MLSKKIGDKVTFERESWKEWFVFYVSYQYRVNGYPIPWGYVQVSSDWGNHRGIILMDGAQYCLGVLYPFIKFWNRMNTVGFSFWRFRVILFMPSWYEIKRWRWTKTVGEGEVTSGAFWVSKSTCIKTLCLPPLMIKYYKPHPNSTCN